MHTKNYSVTFYSCYPQCSPDIAGGIETVHLPRLNEDAIVDLRRGGDLLGAHGARSRMSSQVNRPGARPRYRNRWQSGESLRSPLRGHRSILQLRVRGIRGYESSFRISGSYSTLSLSVLTQVDGEILDTDYCTQMTIFYSDNHARNKNRPRIFTSSMVRIHQDESQKPRLCIVVNYL